MLFTSSFTCSCSEFHIDDSGQNQKCVTAAIADYDYFTQNNLREIIIIRREN